MTSIAKELNRLLADYQVHYQRMRNFHWNVKGPMFFDLHIKFEELYTGAALKVDELAERVLALGKKPLSTFKDQLAHATLTEDGDEGDAKAMVERTLDDLEKLNASIRKIAKDADTATTNMIEPFADEQEKTAWMLGAYLG